MKIDANGMVVESVDDRPKEFALLGQVKGDERDRKFVYYRVKSFKTGARFFY